MAIYIGEASNGLVITYEHSRGAVRLRGRALRSEDGAHVELDAIPGETMRGLKSRLLERLPSASTVQGKAQT